MLMLTANLNPLGNIATSTDPLRFTVTSTLTSDKAEMFLPVTHLNLE